MGTLHNKYGKQDLVKKLELEHFKRKIISFYRYVHINDPEILRDEMYKQFNDLAVLGRVYLAREGINAQINVPESNFECFVEGLNASPYFAGMEFKFAVEEPKYSFLKLKIKVRPKILADGMDDNSYDVTNVGNHLSAKEWNENMDLPDTLVIDVRNHYESEVGHFKGAICPDADTFREELPLVYELLKGKEEKKVLLYCTGGIRCEKTSAFLKHNGFRDVNQLHGGIIDYVRQIKQDGLENKFIGKNFVFDDRLGEEITSDVISDCHQCSNPANNHTNCNNDACHLLFIQCSACEETYNGCCCDECKNIFSMPLEQQKLARKESKIKPANYSKGRIRPKPNKM
jgi:UPF0176 protein